MTGKILVNLAEAQKKTDIQFLTANFVYSLGKVLTKFPNINADAFSKGQLESKIWLIEKLSLISPYPKNTFIMGGWYGVLGLMMLESEEFKNIKIRSFDTDDDCTYIADLLNKTPWVMRDWQFKATTMNVLDLDYKNTVFKTKRSNGSEVELYNVPNTIINTICEHMDKFDIWYSKIPEDVIICLQSNNYFDAPDHVNCVNSLEEFKTQLPNLDIYYQGERKLAKYTRYMIIGKKLPFQKKAGLISATSTFQKVVLS